MATIEIRRMDPQRVLAFHHVGPYEKCGAAWEQLCAFAGPKGLFGPNTRMIGMSHDDPREVPAAELRYDACMTIEADLEVSAPAAIKEIPGGEYAFTVHEGAYEKLSNTYHGVLEEWVEANGRKIAAAPCFEIYLNNPESTPVEELRTEVYLPLEPQ